MGRKKKQKVDERSVKAAISDASEANEAADTEVVLADSDKVAAVGSSTNKPSSWKLETAEWGALGDALLGQYAQRALFELSNLEGKDYIDSYTKLLQYIKPKMTASKLDVEADTTLSVVVIKPNVIENE